MKTLKKLMMLSVALFFIYNNLTVKNTNLPINNGDIGIHTYELDPSIEHESLPY